MDYLHLKLPKIKTHLGHELDLTSSTDVSRKRERNICAIEATLLLPRAAVSAGTFVVIGEAIQKNRERSQCRLTYPAGIQRIYFVQPVDERRTEFYHIYSAADLVSGSTKSDRERLCRECGENRCDFGRLCPANLER